MTTTYYDGIIFKSDGNRYNIITGVLEQLSGGANHNNICNLKDIQFFGGINSGALFAVLCSLKFSMHDLEQKLHTLNSCLMGENQGCLSGFHIMKNRHNSVCNKIIKFVGNILEEQLGNEDVTFYDLYKHNNKYVRLTGFNVTTKDVLFMDFHNTPSMKVLDALRISLCDPLIVSPITINKQKYVAGGTVYTTPYTIFSQINFKKFLLIDVIKSKNLCGNPSRVKEVLEAVRELRTSVYVPSSVDILKILDQRSCDDWNTVQQSEIERLHSLGRVNAEEHIEKLLLRMAAVSSPKTTITKKKDTLSNSAELVSSDKRHSMDVRKNQSIDLERIDKERVVWYMNKLNQI